MLKSKLLLGLFLLFIISLRLKNDNNNAIYFIESGHDCSKSISNMLFSGGGNCERMSSEQTL
jgi:hypothetical protein